MFIIVKQKPNKAVYLSYIFAEKELGKHITACYESTDDKVIGVIYNDSSKSFEEFYSNIV